MSYDDIMMSIPANHVKRLREALGWSQETLAEKAGISRSGLSAIEACRLVPSVVAALAVSRALNCSVEMLFGMATDLPAEVAWAFPPIENQRRFWQARVGQQLLAYPVEDSNQDLTWHDGVADEGQLFRIPGDLPENTLVIASCDPAARLLAAEYTERTRFRLLILRRGSGEALKLLNAGLVHAAGIHLSHGSQNSQNRAAAKKQLKGDFQLVHVARWEEGLAMRTDLKARKSNELLSQKLRWIGREEGSGARQCLDEVLAGRVAPKWEALDHSGVVNAILSGWADVGPCVRLSADEGGLKFISVRHEDCDLCFPTAYESDPRILALLQTLRSTMFRARLAELPGYDTKRTGELR